MANKPKAQKVTDAQVEAAKEIYNVARQQADLEMEKLRAEIQTREEDSFAIGTIKTNKAHRDFGEFLDAVVLYRTHKNKSYKQMGLTWEKFCEAAGHDRRTAERLIADIAPVFERFSDNVPVFAGVGLKQIRYLGKKEAVNLTGFDADGNLIIGDERIPNTPEDINAYVDHLKEINQQAINEKVLDAKAKDRVLKDKEKVIEKLSKSLEKLEGKAKEKELTPEEDGFLKKVDFLRTAFDGYLLQLDPDRIEELAHEADPAPTPRMRAAYLAALDYMKKQILFAFQRATDMYGDPFMCPEAAWRPGMGEEVVLSPEDMERAAKLSKQKD